MKTFTRDNAACFNVRDFGATGDGIAWDTDPVQSAIDACAAAGGGVVWVPEGTYSIRPIRLRSHVNLHLEKGSILLGSADPEDYPEWQSDKFHPHFAAYNARYLIIAEDEEHVSITGEGTIDGQCSAFYDTSDQEADWWAIKDKKTRPGRMLWFALCRHVRIEGITCREAPAWTFWMAGCENVDFHNVTIRTPYKAINTDGIDIDSCRNVRITHCDIRTGDDAIVLRAIERVFRKPVPCERVVVENCTLASNCQAIRLGYLRDGVIRNVTMRNIAIMDSRRGIICQVPSPMETPEKNAERPIAPGPLIENISFSNIRIDALQPVWLYLSDTGCARKIANISFENIHMCGTTASMVKGTKSMAMENVSFKNITIQIHPGKLMYAAPMTLRDKALALSCEYCSNLSLANVTVEGNHPERASDLPVFYFESSSGIELTGVRNLSTHPLGDADCGLKWRELPARKVH